jgi:pyrroloquinoline-quinone synthase
METTEIAHVIATATAGRRLLDHPFYRRWEFGELSVSELRSYAAQYRHFEAMLPGFLADLGGALAEGPARDAVMSNLADELGDPVPHLDLFDRFADALGACHEAARPATTALTDAYSRALAAGPKAALAGLVAYEHQAPEVAASKADGLRAHYGLDDRAVAFWDHHATVDRAHARWTIDALAALDAHDTEVHVHCASVAEAWWAFLDEREAARPAA